MSGMNVQKDKSLAQPEIRNPFVHRLELSTLDKFQIFIMTITLVPLRVFSLFVCLVIAWFFAALALTGQSVDKPMTGWRSWFRPLVVFFSRGVFFMGGFHWVTVKGKRALPEEAPVLAVAPHSTYFDALNVTYLDLTTVVAKSSSRDVPFFGSLTKFTQPVFVSREDPDSRQNTIKEIKRRAHSKGEWPQIVIFPEGTCTNRSCLITFKPGAFLPGEPVQPVCLRYTNKKDTYTWTWEGPTAMQQFWYTLCQWNNCLEIEFLPVYHPSEEEQNDPKLYGENVRRVMAEALGVPTTDHTFEDCRLLNYAVKLNMPATNWVVEFNKVHKKLRNITSDAIKDLVIQHQTLAQKADTVHVDLNLFAEYLDLSPSHPHLKLLFDLFDKDESGLMDFREYVIGLHLVSQPTNTEDTIIFTFQLFDRGHKGRLSQSELSGVLHTAFGLTDVDVRDVFLEVDEAETGSITYEQFKTYAEGRPEYSKLFTVYEGISDVSSEDKRPTTNGQAPHVKSE